MKFDVIDDIDISSLRPINEKLLDELTNRVMKVTKEEDAHSLYHSFYNTKYPVMNLKKQEDLLIKKLEQLKEKFRTLIKTQEQGIYYTWIQLDSENIKETAYRFYLAPNPQNMHKIVEKLTNEFLRQKIPVEFKFQKQANMRKCDRIIIYSDYDNKDRIEKAIATVYNDNPKLFDGSERGFSWIYQSKVPNVYIAPETPGFSYGMKFAEVMKNAKLVSCYLYGLTNSNPVLKDVVDYKKIYRTMNLIICSLLLTNGLCLLKDDKIMQGDEVRIIQNENYWYDCENGILEITLRAQKYYQIKFLPTFKGRKELMDRLCKVYKYENKEGAIARIISLEQRHNEVMDALYGDSSQTKK